MNSTQEIMLRNILMTVTLSLDEIINSLEFIKDQDFASKIKTLRHFKDELTEDSKLISERMDLIENRLTLLNGSLSFTNKKISDDPVINLAISNAAGRAKKAIGKILSLLKNGPNNVVSVVQGEITSLEKLSNRGALNLIYAQIDEKIHFPSLASTCLTYGPEKLIALIHEIDSNAISLNVANRLQHIKEVYQELYRRLEVENGHIYAELLDTMNDPTQIIEPHQMINKSFGLVKISKIEELRDTYNQLSMKIGLYLLRCNDVYENAHLDMVKFKGQEGVIFLLNEIQTRISFFISIQKLVRELDDVILKSFMTVKKNSDKLLQIKFDRKKAQEETRISQSKKAS